MSGPAAALLRYLSRYLRETPGARARLFKLHEAETGRVLHDKNLCSHLAALNQPNCETSLVYLKFLHKAGELIPAKTRGDLFFFKHPAWLKSDK